MLVNTNESQGIVKIRDRWSQTDSMAGVGIDPDGSKIPQEIWDQVGGISNIADGYLLFCKSIIDATHEHVVDFKVNSNFFQGAQGRMALAGVFSYLRQQYPSAIRVCDGKFADIGNTAEQIAEEVFGNLDADAVLLNPYMGYDAIEPFTRWANKLVILCVNTSNLSAEEVQNLQLASGDPLWRHILRLCMDKWNANGNILPVLSATYPENLIGVREIVGQSPILLAGVGSQGGSLESSLPHVIDNNGYGLMISSSRGILYAPRQEGETFQMASKRAVIGLKDRINMTKQKYSLRQ